MRRARWQFALLFGAPLGLLELGLFATSIVYYSRLLPQQAIPLGLLLYVVIPAIARYAAYSRHPNEQPKAAWAGFRVGLVSFTIFMVTTILLFVVLFIRYVAMSPGFNPRAPHQWGLYDPTGMLMNQVTMLGILALLHGIGVMLSAIGGRIGGALALWRARSQMPAHEPQA